MRRGGSTTTSAGEHHSLNIIVLCLFVFLPFSLLLCVFFSTFLLLFFPRTSYLSSVLSFYNTTTSTYTDSFLPVLAWQLFAPTYLPFPRI